MDKAVQNYQEWTEVIRRLVGREDSIYLESLRRMTEKLMKY